MHDERTVLSSHLSGVNLHQAERGSLVGPMTLDDISFIQHGRALE